MVVEALTSVFANAAIPQKIVIAALIAALPLIVVITALGLRMRASKWPTRVVAELRVAGPALGLLVAGLNAFHMGQTIQRLPFSATAKQLAPGILEVSAFAALGALVGAIAVAAHFTLALFSVVDAD